jgi:hypothetical protein
MRTNSGKIAWWIIVILLLASFGMALFVSPDSVYQRLENTASRTGEYSVIVHGLVLTGLLSALIAGNRRALIFNITFVFLTTSATVVGIFFLLPPNVIVFGLILILSISAMRAGYLQLGWSRLTRTSRFFGLLGLTFGFYYLHWVEPPVWWNALFFSPIGSLNCPTLLALSGFAALTRKPSPQKLIFAVAVPTLFFGLYGVFLFQVYIDLLLVACGLFLFIRFGKEQISRQDNNQFP